MTTTDFHSRAVRALTLLHEEHLRAFVVVWRRAQESAVTLPPTEDPSYASLETLLRHVLRAARGYAVWICEQLDLPDPDIPKTPEAHAIAAQADAYLEEVFAGWRRGLAPVTDDRLESPEYASRWKTKYCIDAMLEHAVMHPIRHGFQLEELRTG